MKNNNEFYRLVTKNTSDFISINEFSSDIPHIYVSPSYKLLGYEPKDLIGCSGFEIIHPDDVAKLKPLLEKYLIAVAQKLLVNKKKTAMEKIKFRFKIKDGGWRDMESTVDLVDENKLIFVSKDVTERLKLERQIRKEKETFKKYLDIAGVIIVVINKNNKVTLINQKGCEILGMEKEKIIGRDWFKDFLPLDEKNKTRKVFKDLLQGKAVDSYFKNNILTNQNKKKLIAWHNTIIRDKQDNVIGVFSSGEYIGEKIKIEKKLKESAQKWEETMNFLSSGLSIHAFDFTIIDANRSLCRLLGKSKKEIVGRKCYEIFHNKNKPITECPMLKSLKSKHNERVEIFEPTIKKWLTVATVPIMGEKGQIKKIIHEVNDITKSKQAEIETKKRNEELEKTNKLMVGRELRMVELKNKIKSLEEKLKNLK